MVKLTLLFDYVWELKRRLTNVKRCDFASASPFVSGDDFRNLCDFVFDDLGLTFLPSRVFENALVFVKAYPPLVDYFFRQIHPRVRKPYRLLTHNGDCSLPGEHLARLDDPKLLRWYSTNLDCSHPKASPLPIGILNQRAKSGNVGILNDLLASPPAKLDRVYMNFHIGGASEKADYRAHRQRIHDRFVDCAWVTAEDRVPPREYLKAIATHRFVISPPGHGPDCYRHWEAMCLGSIPVVERSICMAHFVDFPMILVDDWQQVSPSFLKERVNVIESRSFDRSQLYLDYWRGLLK